MLSGIKIVRIILSIPYEEFFYYHITYGSFIRVFSLRLNHPFAMNIKYLPSILEVQKEIKKKNYCREFCLKINLKENMTN